MPRCPTLPAAATPHWIAPARLPELLTGMRRDVTRRPPLHHALAG
jgi:hypothetical protein